MVSSRFIESCLPVATENTLEGAETGNP